MKYLLISLIILLSSCVDSTGTDCSEEQEIKYITKTDTVSITWESVDSSVVEYYNPELHIMDSCVLKVGYNFKERMKKVTFIKDGVHIDSTIQYSVEPIISAPRKYIEWQY